MIISALSGERLESPIYLSRSDRSITSLSQIHKGITKVYFDRSIGHLQTNEIGDVDTYYDKEYQIFDESEEDDILYKVIDGRKVFRQEHQVNTLISKVTLTPGMKILDYGCAKGTVLKRLHAARPDIEPYLFDVSQMYVHLWDKFLSSSHYASYQPRQEWKGTFDLVTSFFAFEHTPDPLKELASIKGLLRPGGQMYMIVPNVYENTGDFIVADHVHHYSELSLKYMFEKAGFEVMSIDSASHFAAFIVLARNTAAASTFRADPADLQSVGNKAMEMADFWEELQTRINAFEEKMGDKKAAIYGAGVYGNFIAASLRNFGRVNFFIDQNPLLHGKTMIGKPVILPKEIPSGVQLVYVGINPITARAAMGSIDWHGDEPNFFYL